MGNFLTRIRNKDFLEKYARVGLSAKGVVYCLLGILAFSSAIGLSSQKGSRQEAFKLVNDQPFGKVLLVLIGVCILGFVVLRFFQSVMDSDHKGNDGKALFRRFGLAVSALVYIGISATAFKMAFAGSGGEDSKKFFLSRIMEYPGGRILVGLVALILLGQGIYQIYKGASGKFMKKVKLYHSSFSSTFKKVGLVGNVSRGVVMCIIAYFFLRASFHANPDEAGDTGTAFGFLQEKGGNILMGTVALGLLAYGLFMFVRARHERISF